MNALLHKQAVLMILLFSQQIVCLENEKPKQSTNKYEQVSSDVESSNQKKRKSSISKCCFYLGSVGVVALWSGMCIAAGASFAKSVQCP